jgi:hypothetical protein
MNNLCLEEFINVLTFLPSNALLSISATCASFRTVLNFTDPLIWKMRCAERWKGKQGYATFLQTVVQPQLKLDQEWISSAMSQSRRTMTENTSSCCKITLPVMLKNIRDVLLLDRKLQPIVISPQQQQSSNAVTNSTAIQSVEDEINHNVEKGNEVTWKFAFYMSIRDAKRALLTKNELVRSKWLLRFAQLPHETFLVDFTWENQIVTATHGTMLCQIGQGGKELNVAGIPTLLVGRKTTAGVGEGDDDGVDNDSWGWKMSNRFAEIWSVDVPVPVYLMRLKRTCSPRPP